MLMHPLAAAMLERQVVEATTTNTIRDLAIRDLAVASTAAPSTTNKIIPLLVVGPTVLLSQPILGREPRQGATATPTARRSQPAIPRAMHLRAFPHSLVNPTNHPIPANLPALRMGLPTFKGLVNMPNLLRSGLNKVKHSLIIQVGAGVVVIRVIEVVLSLAHIQRIISQRLLRSRHMDIPPVLLRRFRGLLLPITGLVTKVTVVAVTLTRAEEHTQ